MERKIADIDQPVIVCGWGRVGRAIAKDVADAGARRMHAGGRVRPRREAISRTRSRAVLGAVLLDLRGARRAAGCAAACSRRSPGRRARSAPPPPRTSCGTAAACSSSQQCESTNVNTSTRRRWISSRPFGVDARHLDQRLVGDGEPAEVGEGAQHVDVVGVVGRPPVLGRVAQQPGVGEVADERGVDARGVEQLVVVVGGLLRTEEQPGEGARVVALEERVDGGEREAPRLEGADAFEPLEVLGAEAAGAPVALAARRGGPRAGSSGSCRPRLRPAGPARRCASRSRNDLKEWGHGGRDIGRRSEPDHVAECLTSLLRSRYSEGQHVESPSIVEDGFSAQDERPGSR